MQPLSKASAAEAPPAPNPRPVVYADSLAALEHAWANGLPRDIRVRTLAPAILARRDIAAERADERLTPDCTHALQRALEGAAATLRERAELWPGDSGPHRAAVAATALLSELQNHVFPAASLRDADFDGAARVVAARHETADMRRRFYNGVAALLDGAAEIVEVPASVLPPIEEPTPPAPDFMTRLAHSGQGALGYRLGLALWRRLPGAGPRGEILVYRENELLKETAAALLARGFAVRTLAAPKSGAPEYNEESPAAGAAEAILREALAPHMTARAAAALAAEGRRLVAAQLGRFEAARRAWDNELDARRRPLAVLSNYLHSPEYRALHAALQDRGVPLVAFQHGVTSEIAASRADADHALEGAGSDLAIVFNARMTALAEAAPAATAPTVAVGMPGDYRRLGRRRARSGAQPLWYVRTTLYQSNLGRLHRGLADPGMYDRETRLIDEVFSGLPHKVAIKPYPAIRYLDPDPLDAAVDAVPNLELYRDRQDLRFVVSQARILITAGATSTVSWCLMSGRPVVFLDSADMCPLSEEARAAFEPAVFLFDLGAPDAYAALRAFLSRPIADIERDWAARAGARERLIRGFLDSGAPRPGRRASEAITAYLASNGKQRRREP